MGQYIVYNSIILYTWWEYSKRTQQSDTRYVNHAFPDTIIMCVYVCVVVCTVWIVRRRLKLFAPIFTGDSFYSSLCWRVPRVWRRRAAFITQLLATSRRAPFISGADTASRMSNARVASVSALAVDTCAVHTQLVVGRTDDGLQRQRAKYNILQVFAAQRLRIILQSAPI